MKKIYDSFFLTPYRALFLHLLLTGYPFKFGLFLTGWAVSWVGAPCSVFQKEVCSESESFALMDLAVRFNQFYQLSWFVWLSMRTSTTIAVAFHKILLGTSTLTLVGLAWVQPELIAGRKGPLDPKVSFEWAVCYGLACFLSAWTVHLHSKAVTESKKWSIPANAIFWGAVINLFTSVAFFQALFTKSGVAAYYRNGTTEIILFAFTMGAVFTFVHAVLLFRIRTFLTVSQLRSVCLYKLVLNLAMPFIWFPENNTTVLDISRALGVTIRISVTSTYLFGFWWAGKAEGVSRILTSEKED